MIGETILKQLGGNKFLITTGVNNLKQYKNSLLMTLPKNKSKANKLQIILIDYNLYTLKFLKETKMGIKEVNTFSGVYGNQLTELFTQITGLYTTL